MRAIILSVGLMFAASAVSAQTVVTPPAKPADASKQICKKQPKEGSKLTKKICMTKAEWDYVSDVTREEFAKIQNASTPAMASGD